MYHFRLPILVIAVLTGAGLAATPEVAVAGPGTAAASGSGWTSSVSFTNQVASSPTTGGGYPVPPGQTFPNPGTCGRGSLDSNHSESWIAVKPGTEDLVGNSKFFFDKYSKFYNFYLGTYRILNGTPVDNNQVQGYECVSTGTQAMPPSWTDVTDPNVAFDTKGRAYQTTLPFNAFWGGSTLHPDGAIDVSYSDDMGQHWVKGNGGQDLEQSPSDSRSSTRCPPAARAVLVPRAFPVRLLARDPSGGEVPGSDRLSSARSVSARPLLRRWRARTERHVVHAAQDAAVGRPGEKNPLPLQVAERGRRYVLAVERPADPAGDQLARDSQRIPSHRPRRS
jgi:hypothetical protein